METYPSGAWQGRLFGRYKVERLLGHGGTSEVWLALDTQLRRQVALKMLPTILSNEQDYLRDFTDEARAAAALEHPHILGIHDFGEEEVSPGEVVPYLVLPYVPGGTLAERQSTVSGLLPLQESLRYLRQAALAIDYAHSQQVLHRNIKPANMLLREDWLLLSDFGMARLLEGSLARGKSFVGVGTSEYMAPEQIMGQAQPASDRYSLAAVAYQLFTGHTPFHADTPAETIALQMQGTLPLPGQFNPEMPPRVERLLLLALSRKIEQRPPSCVVMVDTLQHAWLSGTEAQDDPNATLLAPWSKRLRDGSSTHLPVVSVDDDAPAWEVVPGRDSSPSHPPVSGSMQFPTPPHSIPLLSTPLPAPVSPGAALHPDDEGKTTPSPSATNPMSLDQVPLIDPSATNIMSLDSVPSDSSASSLPSGSQTLEQKVGRRTILLGGGIIAAVVIAGGAISYELLHSQAVNSQKKILTAVPPTPLPGPHQLMAGLPLLGLEGHADGIWTASWDPTGRYLVTAGSDGSIMLWDILTTLQHQARGMTVATPLKQWKVAGILFQYQPNFLQWSLDGKKLIVSGSFSDKFYVLDAFSSSETPVIYDDIDLTTLGADILYDGVTPGPSKDQCTIIGNGSPGALVQVWTFGKTDAPVLNYDVSDNLSIVGWSADKKVLAGLTGVLGLTDVVFTWKSTNLRHSQSWARPKRALTFAGWSDTLAWSPIDPHLLLVSNGDVAVILDERQNAPILTLGLQVDENSPAPCLSTLGWSPNGRYITASYQPLSGPPVPFPDPPIYVWDVQALLKAAPSPDALQPPVLTFSSPIGALAHTMPILDVEWSPDGRYLATSALDKTVIIWQMDR